MSNMNTQSKNHSQLGRHHAFEDSRTDMHCIMVRKGSRLHITPHPIEAEGTPKHELKVAKRRKRCVGNVRCDGRSLKRTAMHKTPSGPELNLHGRDVAAHSTGQQAVKVGLCHNESIVVVESLVVNGFGVACCV